MLDFDLAEIYGYSTKAFNQQVKNNIERFDDDFRFQLSDAEVSELSRSKILTSMQTKGIKGGRTYKKTPAPTEVRTGVTYCGFDTPLRAAQPPRVITYLISE